MGNKGAAVCVICCFMFAPFVLQSVGFFTPNWGSNTTCDAIGLLYSCCSHPNGSDGCGNNEGADELDARVLGLQATSFSIMFLTIVGLCCGLCNDDDDDTGWCSIIGGCCMVFFPFAGLFSIIGCIIVATIFTTSELGYSFALCLTSGCFVVLITIILIVCACKLLKEDADETPDTQTHVAHTQSSGNVYTSDTDREIVPSYSRGEVVAHQATMQQAVAIHDEESGGVMVLIRKINITRLAYRIQHSID
ncbi:hypothetical protein ACF0H5_016169 [Mactra antiquata]